MKAGSSRDSSREAGLLALARGSQWAAGVAPPISRLRLLPPPPHLSPQQRGAEGGASGAAGGPAKSRGGGGGGAMATAAGRGRGSTGPVADCRDRHAGGRWRRPQGWVAAPTTGRPEGCPGGPGPQRLSVARFFPLATHKTSGLYTVRPKRNKRKRNVRFGARATITNCQHFENFNVDSYTFPEKAHLEENFNTNRTSFCFVLLESFQIF